MEHKDADAELKALDETGEGVLRFIRFHQEDKDADITLPGFVGQQEAVLIASHNWKSDYPPLGKGVSYEAEGATYFKFQLNMADDRAKAWRSWLQMGGALQQVSYGFSPYADAVQHGQNQGKSVRFLKPRPDGSPGAKLHEVSFVTVGSGNDQGVLSVKTATAMPPLPATPSLPLVSTPVIPPRDASPSHVIPPHHQTTDDRVWNAWVQQARVKATADRVNYYHALYAVSDLAGATERKAFRGLHHFVTEAGEPGPASTRACLELIYALHKGYFPSHEREGLYTHLAEHLRDAGIEPPPMAAPDSYGVPLDMRVQASTWAVDAALDDLIGIHEVRSHKGMTLNEARLQQVKDLWSRVDAFCQILQLQAPKPYSAQVEEFSNRQFIEKLNARLEASAQAIDAQQQEASRTEADALYRRFVETERRLSDVRAP